MVSTQNVTAMTSQSNFLLAAVRMLPSDVSLVVNFKLILTVWTVEFYVLHFLSQFLIHWFDESILGKDLAVSRAFHPSTHLNAVPA